MFNLTIFSNYSIGNRVITKDGFIGKIEAKRNRYCGIEYLVCGTSFSKGYGEHHWYKEGSIADSLSEAQEKLFDHIFGEIKDIKRNTQWKIEPIKADNTALYNAILELNNRLGKLEKAKEETNANR